MKSYNVTVIFISGNTSYFPGVKAYNKRDANNRVIAELWRRGLSKKDVRKIIAEVAINYN